jgi:hypothetical protein
MNCTSENLCDKKWILIIVRIHMQYDVIWFSLPDFWLDRPYSITVVAKDQKTILTQISLCKYIVGDPNQKKPKKPNTNRIGTNRSKTIEWSTKREKGQ